MTVPVNVRKALEAGISVIPQVPGSKQPLVKWSRYQQELPSMGRVERWAEKFGDKAVWAMVCGQASGYIVLDFDDERTFRRYKLDPFVRTPSGGYHVWVLSPNFRVRGGSRVDAEKFPGLDLKSDGHLATFTGKGYKLLRGEVYQLDTLPEPLANLIRSRKWVDRDSVPLPEEYNDFVPKDELLSAAMALVKGGEPRNQTGFWLACQMRDERYTNKDAWNLLLKFAQAVNPNGEHPYSEQEAYNSLMQAFNSPARLPRSLVPDGTKFSNILQNEVFRDKARQWLRSEKLGPLEAEGLRGVLDLKEIAFTVNELMPESSNVLLNGPKKAGKTTLALNLSRALIDDKLFLGRFRVTPLNGSLGYWNYEMSLRQLNGWLRRMNLKDPEGFVHWPLRGDHVDLMDDSTFAYMVEQLKVNEIEFLVIDTWWRAIAGIVDENSNAEVSAFLERLDMLKGKSGVRDLLITTHSGKKVARGEETARGASALEGWADVLWNLVREGGERYLRAEGRDVAVEMGHLIFDEEHHRVDWVGGAPGEEKLEQAIQMAVQAVKTNEGLTRGAIYATLVGKTDTKNKAIQEATERGLIRSERVGKGMAYYLGGEVKRKEELKKRKNKRPRINQLRQAEDET
jgi:hypothetical protein